MDRCRGIRRTLIAYCQERRQEGEPFKVLIPDACFRQKGNDEQVLKAALNDPRRKNKVTLALKTFRARLLDSVNRE